MRRLFFVLHGKTLNVGRVQTPNLKMLVDRDAMITSFKKEKYYVVRLSLGARKRQARESAPLMKRKHLKRLAKRRRPFVFPSSARRKPSSRPALQQAALYAGCGLYAGYCPNTWQQKGIRPSRHYPHYGVCENRACDAAGERKEYPHPCRGASAVRRRRAARL